MRKFITTNRESGQVAIISVMFFTILFSVIVVSFVQNVLAEQRQTTNNELSASALTAAESGLEDAKRILTYCTAAPTTAGCESIYDPTSNSCDAILNSGSLMTTLGISVDSDKKATVNEKSKEYYSCMIINYLTDNYTGSIEADGKSTIIPLELATYASGSATPATAAAYFTINWHNNSPSVNGVMSGLDNSTDLPTVQTWKSGGNRPAVLRIELVTVPTTGFTLDGITDSARAVTLRPITGSTNGGATIATGGTSAYNLDHWTQKTEPNTFSGVATNNPVMYVNCSSSNAYACTARFTLTGGSLNLSSNDYYLRVQAIYNSADFQITATGTSGQVMYFDGIQPSVDVTGRAVDAYKRISSRIEARSNNDNYNWWPEYALQSGNAICKDMTVDSDAGVDNCSY